MLKYLIACAILISTNNLECMTPAKGSFIPLNKILEHLTYIEKLKQKVKALLNSEIKVTAKKYILALNNCAFNAECYEELQQLLEKGVNPNDESCDALYGACFSGAIENVKLLLQYNANPNRLDLINKETPLIRALKSGYLEIFKLLLAKGANPNMSDELGITPLIYACTKNIFYLIAIQKTIYGRTKPDIFENIPLDFEDPNAYSKIEEARKSFISALLETNAQIDIKYKGETAIDFALQEYLIDAVEFIAKKRPMILSLKHICIKNIKKYRFTEKEICSRLEPKLQELFIRRRCNTCKKTKFDLIRLSLCGKCKSVYYCSKSCQKEDWPFHKQFCERID